MQRINRSEMEEFRLTLRRFFAEFASTTHTRVLMETPEGYDDAIWKRMANELGLQGLAIPQEFGGSGYSFIELGTVFEEMGYALVCAPFFSTVALAASTLMLCDDAKAQHAWLPRISDGSLIATVAYVDVDDRPVIATPRDGGWSLTGQKTFVLDGAIAELLLVLAATPAGTGIFAVDTTKDGPLAVPQDSVDRTRKLAKLTFDDTAAELVVSPGDAGRRVLVEASELATIALAREQVGGTQACLDMTVDYTKNRHQFGRPIGSFQAVKHQLADLLMNLESSRSVADWACRCAAEELPDAPLAAALAGAVCADTYVSTSAVTIQLHGGIGFTWDHDAHLYFKRAKASQLLLGTPDEHRRRHAELIGLGS